VQRHPAHEDFPALPAANRYEVLGVEVPRPGGGTRIPRRLRTQLEQSFDTDLSGIRAGSARC